MLSSRPHAMSSPALDRLAPALDLLRANAEAADRAGDLPAGNIEALRKAGAFAWSRARSLKGDELLAAEKAAAWEAIGAADLSTAWIFSNYDSFIWELSFGSCFDPFPELERVLLEEEPVCGTVAMVPGSVIDGGVIVVSGRFPFATGSSLARWMRSNVVVPGPAPELPPADPASRSHVRSVMIDLARPEVRTERTWDGMGLRATQTDTVVVEGLRLPLSYSRLSAYDSIRMDPRLAVPSPYYREPGWAIANARIGASLAGAAGAAFEFAHQQTLGRTNLTGAPAARFPAVRACIADAFLELVTARALQGGLAAASDERVRTATAWTPGAEAAIWASGAASAQAVLRAVDQLALAVGGTGTSRSLPFERHVRDIRTGAVHLGINPNLVRDRVAAHLFPDFAKP